MEKTTSINVGKILKPHGLRGELRVLFYDVSRLQYYANREFFYVLKNGQEEKLFVESTRLHKNFLLIFFKGIEGIDAAEQWRNLELFIERGELENLNDGEFYYWDLVGMEVFNSTGSCVGSVKEVFDNGAGAILKVVSSAEGKKLHIPFIDDAIIVVNAGANRIEVSDEFLEV